MSLVDEQAAFLLDVGKVVEFAVNMGFKVTAGEFQRTPEQQKLYVSQGKSKTMNSYHLKRLAADLNFILDGKLCLDKKVLQPVGDYWESLSTKNRWGGNFSGFLDVPHFERRA